MNPKRNGIAREKKEARKGCGRPLKQPATRAPEVRVFSRIESGTLEPSKALPKLKREMAKGQPRKGVGQPSEPNAKDAKGVVYP